MASSSPWQYGGALLLGVIFGASQCPTWKDRDVCRMVGRTGRVDHVVGLLATLGHKRLVVIHRPVARYP